MKPIRLVILGYILAGFMFIIVASYALLYANGYKPDWDNLTFKKIGFILIESYPKGAAIKLAGKELDRATPATLKRLLPDNYLMELTKNSYRPWQGDITVQSGLVTEKRNVLLTLTELQPNILIENIIDKIVGTPDNSRIAVLTQKELWQWDINNQTSSVLVNPELIRQHIKATNTTDIANGQLFPISFSPDSQLLLFRSTSKYNQYFLVINVRSGIIKLIATGRQLTKWQWLSNTELVNWQIGKLNLIDIVANKTIVTVPNVSDMGIFDNNIYAAVTTNKITALVKINRGNNINETIAILPVGETYTFGKINNNWLCTVTNKQTTALWLSERINSEIVWSKLADGIALPILWDDTYLIYRQNKQVLVREWKKLEEIPVIILDNQRDAQLIHFSYDTALYLSGNKLMSIDLTGMNNYELVNLAMPGDLILTDTQMSKLTYIDGKTHQLIEVNLRDKSGYFF
ncbi:PEGA domain-containing protein [Patescibacteria group bacterium]|nr:PEGA domain-containing protein [Patescibacteria group bacterium]